MRLRYLIAERHANLLLWDKLRMHVWYSIANVTENSVLYSASEAIPAYISSCIGRSVCTSINQKLSDLYATKVFNNR